MGNITSTIYESLNDEPAFKKPSLRNHDKLSLNDIREQASWTLDKKKKKRRLERFRRERRKKWNAATEAFALSRPHFESESRHAWECTAILGSGGFGVVGLWQQLGETGTPIDSVAIKQINDDDHARLVECYEYTVPMEALCMYELRDCPTISRLRSVKSFTGSRRDPRVWRLYQEFCPNRTIKDMIDLYSEYNRKHRRAQQRIPEAFVWWVWHGLAMVLHSMDQSNTCRQMVEQPPDKKRWILHLDIKDVNVLLGTTPSRGILKDYPRVKVCDWGLAVATSKSDPDNSALYKKWGTECWLPPEQYGRDGRLDRHWHRKIHRKNMPFTSAHGCWQFAALIFGMVRLDVHNEILYNALETAEGAERYCRESGYKLFQNAPGNDLSKHYSRELLYLLEQCLNLVPEARPDAVELAMKTLAGCNLEAQRRKDQGRPGAPYVFYGNNGLKDMERYFKP